MNAKYDSIGDNYDTTRRADPEITRIIAKLLQLDNNKKYLDLACGTGNYTNALSNIAGQWFGCDNSELMLNEARNKSTHIQWDQFDVENLAYEDKYFDGIVCSLAIHHFSDLIIAFSEVRRVLKEDSPFVIFTSTKEQMEEYWLKDYFPSMMSQSIDQMPSSQEIISALQTSGFKSTECQPFWVTNELKDFFLYSGKYRPEIYLNSEVQKGISSFRNFCTNSELKAGTEKLRSNLANLKFTSPDKNILGDYLFVCAK